MAASDISIRGAREHNLRSLDLVLPRNKLICLTGVSGSGKSSLAFDTLYAEGQRRYVESLSSFARQFLGQMPKPEVDLIEGLSPSISISQKSAGNNRRSTVGTITEIYDYLRVLFARTGHGHCPNCGRAITAQSREQILGHIEALAEGTRYAILAPLIRRQKGQYKDLFTDLLKQGFVRARVDGNTVQLTDDLQLDRQMRHTIEVVVDRLVAGKAQRARMAEAVELALRLGEGELLVVVEEDDERKAEGGRMKDEEDVAEDEIPRPDSRFKIQDSRSDLRLSADYACTHCGLSFEPPSPQLFSFNSPQGMCPQCDGLGESYSFGIELLIPDPAKSFEQGCFELLGPLKDLGRWKRHIYEGVAETLEHNHQLEPGTILGTPWNELDPALQELLLWGTGETHITFTWRKGSAPTKYGGHYEGIIPELLSKYRNSQSKMQRRQLEKYMRVVRCPACEGQRLNPQARSVTVTTASEHFADQPQRSLPDVCSLAVSEAAEFFRELVQSPTEATIAGEVLKEIRGRLGFLTNVGLEYLTLARTAPTLSGGESQRIRLAGQIGCGLVGVLYILDEPSIGLHPRDNDRLLATLAQLRDQGNTVVVVEHDEDTMRAADHILDFGPGPGVRGGELVVAGSLSKVLREARSVTGQFLSGKRKIEIPKQRRLTDDGSRNAANNGAHRRGDASALIPDKSEIQDSRSKILTVHGARHNNLKNIDVEIPLGAFVCVTGASGSGKSSLVNDILVEALRRDLNGGEGEPGDHDAIEGLEHLDKLIAIDQSPIGRTPRSNPGTYIKVFDEIRKLYTQLPESKTRGYKAGRFSFNVSGGRCEACEGNGSNRLEMDFLADVWVTCPVCQGHRFNRETLQVRFKGKSIADVLEMDVQQALEHFENIPAIRAKLQTLHDVGLDYLKIGQPSPTLSGGEAQRIKLARELVKKSTGKTLYLLDEPTTGLHFADIEMLLKVLHGFADAGNTVLVVEHNLDVIKTADWIIDLGPDGGAGGGQIIAVGTPEQVATVTESYTGQSLATVLGTEGKRQKANGKSRKGRKQAAGTSKIVVRGARQHNLKNVDVEIPRDEMTVFCGPSGSGKSSLAMDTIYAEGQRRYVESLSAYARQFVGQMQKPTVEHVEGLSPAIAIEQKNMGNTPRSTVGTVTEVYDYFRILLARLGQPHCPDCDVAIGTQTADQITDKIMALPEGTRLLLCAPVEIHVGERYEHLWDDLRSEGYLRVRVDGQTHTLDDPPSIDRRRKHAVEVVVDRISIQQKSRSRIAESVEKALDLGRGVLAAVEVREGVDETKWPATVHSQHFACDRCGRSFDPLTPHSFSFNSSLGWCPSCEGLGTQTGANPAALLRDPKLSLAEGAVGVWPPPESPIFREMLAAFCRATGIPADVPFERLSTRHRRVVLYGTGDDWYEVVGDAAANNGKPDKGATRFRFQYKGLYPALDDAARLSPSLRTRLEHLVGEVQCAECDGSRLRDDAGAVRFRDRTIGEWCQLPLAQLLPIVESWELSPREQKVAGELVREIRNRVRFLVDVGLDYLTLHRQAPTLSGGEAQRIRLASQVGSGLCGVLYVLDEPTIGLHPRDNTRLVAALRKLRDLGNTLLVVEHDREVVEGADRLLDFGPRAGEHGGEIVAQGTPAQVTRKRTSVTGPYLSGKKAIAVPTNRRVEGLEDRGWGLGEGRIEDRGARGGGKKKSAVKGTTKRELDAVSRSQILDSRFPPQSFPHGALEVIGARHNNLRGIDVAIPLSTLTAVTGVSGSGKSSLIEDTLYAALARALHRAGTVPAPHDAIRGIENINKVIRVDQQPLGNSPTSNPATYTGLFDLVRSLFAQLPDAKVRGYTPRRFSFNVAGGRCEACEGNGQRKIEMHFLPDVWVECDACRGRRYEPETLAVRYREQSIADVLEMSCGRARELFENIPKIRRILQTLCDVGLDYVKLGQSAPTLSGGEAQRVKLAAELARPDTGRTLYLLDEPTTGLHFDDLAKLLDVLHRLVDLGNTVVVIEHNMDVIKTADWILDLGPEAGDGGGFLVAAGTPEDVVAQAAVYQQSGKSKDGAPPMRSYTGELLGPVLQAGPHVKRKLYDFAAAEATRAEDVDINEVGQDVKMPWETSGRRWHTVDRVARNGSPCKWDGRILARVVDRIQEQGNFSETNWNARSVVEIAAEKKSDGWFLHAITGEQWLLKLKFRVAKSTFKRRDVIEQLDLAPPNQMPDLPVYGNEPRVKCKNLRGPWQEIELRVHALEEIDRPQFWQFVDEAVAGFGRFADRVQQKPEDIMPWKVLGQKWHLARRGFPPGKKILWESDLLEELIELLQGAAPQGQFLWNNQQLVHIFVPEQKEPWATIHTKRLASLDLSLTGPKDAIAFGRAAEIGHEPQFDATGANRDVLRLHFTDSVQLDDALVRLLREHREALSAAYSAT